VPNPDAISAPAKLRFNAPHRGIEAPITPLVQELTQ
jgi:hypothetical protein